ncbi:MAG: hypothetical protein HC923_08640 [Myxococcales bacterium]|nr:hypothetical protein [Myxococcales bacterium]
MQIQARRGDKEGLERARRELDELHPGHPLAGGAARSGPSADLLPDPDSISIDISENSGTFEPLLEDGASLELAIDEDADPFAGAVIEDSVIESVVLEPEVAQSRALASETSRGPAPLLLPEPERIPSGVFQVPAAPDENDILLLEDVEGADDAWPPHELPLPTRCELSGPRGRII